MKKKQLRLGVLGNGHLESLVLTRDSAKGRITVTHRPLRRKAGTAASQLAPRLASLSRASERVPLSLSLSRPAFQPSRSQRDPSQLNTSTINSCILGPILHGTSLRALDITEIKLEPQFMAVEACLQGSYNA